MEKLLSTIKESFASEVIWILLGIVLGKLIEFFIVMVKGKWRKRQLRKELRQHDSISIDSSNILSLDHADPTYHLHDIVVELTEKKLFIDCPEEYKAVIRQLDSDFAFSENRSFNRSNIFEDLATITLIDNLPALITKHSLLVAEQIITKIKNKHTIFNGKKYGVYRIQRKRNADHDENASIRLELFETDYFTHLVFRSVYKELKDAGHPISQIEKMEELHTYTPFLTSFGINTFIVIDTPEGNELVFAKRSKYLGPGNSESLWHVTMNEGLTITDREGRDISLIKCLHRGLREELGIKEEHHKYIDDEQFMDLFLETTRFEIGLTSYIRMDRNMEQLNLLYSIAKDGELETDGLKAVPLKKKDIKNFLSEENLTDAAKYTLVMYLARSKFIN